MISTIQGNVWDRFVSGDTSCFRKLFVSYYKGLFGYGLKLCGDPDLVEDSIQDLFETIWKRRENLSHISSPNVYLYVSLRRNIYHALKFKNRMARLDPDEPSESDLFQINFDTEELLIKKEALKEQKEELQKALNQLSNQQKEVLYLHYFNGMSYGEIEEILNINRQSVRNHMYRAMTSLRTILDLDIMRLVISALFGLKFLTGSMSGCGFF